LVSATKFTRVQGADIVMESLALIELFVVQFALSGGSPRACSGTSSVKLF